MDLYEFFSVAECLVIIGIVSIVVEVLFFGFSTFFLLFMGLSCIGHKFELNSDLSPDKALKYRYSGVDWIVKSPEAIKAGQTVKVINLDVGVLIVTKTEK